MAEALAIVSVVASIVQLVDFSTKVVHRLDEFTSHAGDVPKCFRHVKTELPLLNTTLQQMQTAIDTNSVTDGTRKTLLPVIAGCHEQIAKLDTILKKSLPEDTDSWRTKGKKAMVSLRHDTAVENITQVLRNYIGILTFYCVAASSTLQPLTGEFYEGNAKLCKIRQWLSAPDPSTNYQKALKLRQADTGLWLLEGTKYARWKTEAASSLWLHGIPGCGKTILSSTVLQNVLDHCHDDPGKVTAYFFFDFSDVQKQSPEMMLRSLLCQLSQRFIKIPQSLDALFSSCDNGQRQPSEHALLETLQSMIQDFPLTYVVLDALDECAESEELMSMLETIAGWQLQNLHLLVTSRREHAIESSLEGFIRSEDRIDLESTLVDKDIQRYVRQKLSDDTRLRRWKKDASTMADIEDTLMSGAKGMFRWAVCQLDELAKCVNKKMLQKALKTLPPTLDQTYERILARISEDYSHYALRILQWLAFSARPLSIDEVAEVAAVDGKRDPAFDPDEVLESPSDALAICSSLITVTSHYDDERENTPKNVIALAHYSVKEYLLSERIRVGKAALYSMQDNVCHEAIATGCIGYLLQLQQPKLTKEDVKTSKLARYSAELWFDHAQKAGERIKKISQIAIHLFSKENPAYLNWIRMFDPEDLRRKPDLKKGIKDVQAPLYYAARLGLRNLVQLLLENNADVNVQGGRFGSALQAASSRGHERIVKLLLKNNADVNAQGGHFGNALEAASWRGHEQIVKLLLENNADVNAQEGGYYGSALRAASYEGHEQIVKLLLKDNADVNAQGGHFGNALEAASWRGHEQIVKLLLKNNADVNAQGGHFGNALEAASYTGHEQIVQLLLMNNADVNAQGRRYGNALQAASSRGHEQIVKLLKKHGAVMPDWSDEDV